MPSAPFLGASMGNMFNNATQGIVQGNLQRMKLDRQANQDALAEKRLNLYDKRLEMESLSHQSAAVDGFIKGAMNFYKTTGNAEATKQFWNQNASRYGLQNIDSFNPIDEDQMQVHFDSGQGIVFSKKNGTASLLKNPDGSVFQAPRTLEQQAKDQEAAMKIGGMAGEQYDPEQAKWAGVNLNSDQKKITVDNARKLKRMALSSYANLEKGSTDDPFAMMVMEKMGIDPAVARKGDSETLKRVKQAVDEEVAGYDKIINEAEQSGVASTSTRKPTAKLTPLDQPRIQKVTGILKGKPANVYSFDGGKYVVNWDGSKVVQ